MTEIDKILNDMIDAARQAGALTLEHFKRFRDLEIGIKGPGDFVSDADRDSETLIRNHLLSRYPGWSLTGEEFPPTEGENQDYRFLVDPIDGTTNFLNGQHYTITISLRHGRQTLCGLIYNPVSDEMFTAIQGGGAFLNGERLQVSQSQDVALMAVGTGLPTPNLSLHPGAYARLDAIRAPIGGVRIVGSAANSCAYVACGRLTGYFEETGFGDTAAGILMVLEAGGVVTDWWGRGPEYYEATGAMIVANPATHAYLIEQLKDVPQKNP
ncbi:inositol monophosphatase family protein [Devosia chinhatensis]|uniref:Inositol-1-monophosphatase n=1 Tax=Devosia chinhatensis TaxID=429727 RepID=A0A0F5FJQ5_9HYPH|nr:inositol monophosphatase family protein [Devosia chinhatensis]KKB09114.1 extragenic suppressor protein SuhB [Devosia chinhatensis]